MSKNPHAPAKPGKPPAPRNVVELPLFVFLTWGTWPPIQLLLGVPYRDLDDRFASGRARVDAIHPTARRNLHPCVSTDVARRRMLASTGERASFAIMSGRTERRGPQRASGSVQNIVDIGMGLPTTALAWMLIWRDHGIVGRRLGSESLARPYQGWYAQLPTMQMRIRKQRERLREQGASDTPSVMMPKDLAGLRTAAVIAARGAAAYCGGENAHRLVADAFERYGRWDGQLAGIPLPAVDRYRYHFDVRTIAPYFAAPGAELANYAGEATHVIVHEPKSTKKKSA